MSYKVVKHFAPSIFDDHEKFFPSPYSKFPISIHFENNLKIVGLLIFVYHYFNDFSFQLHSFSILIFIGHNVNNVSIFYSTVVEAEWIYDSMRSADFDNAWLTVKDAILDKFAGPPDTGVYSPSVQHTLYQAQKVVLEKVPEVSIVVLISINAFEHEFFEVVVLSDKM